MKRRLFIILLLPSLMSLAQTSEEMLRKYSGLGLPLICITTTDGKEPTSTNIQHPEGLIGASITNVVPKEACMQIYRADTLWYDSGEYQKGESGIIIKHRGNTSAYHYNNKPFKLTLEKKTDLIITPEDDGTDRRSKHWVLLNCSFSIRSHFISQLAKLIGMEYAPRVEYVNVIVNNNYRGIYILSENVRREDCRVDVDQEDGYVIELNAYFWNEPFFIPSKLTWFAQWTLKYPDPEDLTEEQEANIRSDIERLEQSVSSHNYPEVIDVPSVARWILLHDILGTYDSGGSNIFVAKKNRESLMRMPVGWDMDSSMRYLEQWSRTHTEQGLFFSRLFANQYCPDFSIAYINDWRRVLEAGVMEQMAQSSLDFPNTAQGQGLKRSYPLHAKRWGYDVSIFDVDVQSQAAVDWFTGRKQTLDALVSELEDYVTAIETPAPVGKTGSSVRKQILGNRIVITTSDGDYTLTGQRIMKGN